MAKLPVKTLAIVLLTLVILAIAIVLTLKPATKTTALPAVPNKTMIILWVTPFGGTSNYTLPQWAIPGVVVWYQCDNPGASVALVSQQMRLIQMYLSENKTVFINLMCELPTEWRGLLNYINVPTYIIQDLMNIDPGGRGLYIGFSEERTCVENPVCRSTMVNIYRELKALFPEAGFFYYADGDNITDVLILAKEANLTIVGRDNYDYYYVNGTVIVPSYVISDLIYLERNGYNGSLLMGELGLRVCDQYAYIQASQNPYIGPRNCTAPAIYESQILKQYISKVHPTYVGIWAWNGPPFGIVDNPLMIRVLSQFAEAPKPRLIKPPGNIINVTFWGGWNIQGVISLIVNYTLHTGNYISYSIMPTIGTMPNETYILTKARVRELPNVMQVNGGPSLLALPLLGAALLNFTPTLSNVAGSAMVINGGVSNVMLANTFNTTMLALPITVYRGGLLFINVNLLREYGLPIPGTITQLINDTQMLANYGFTCIWVIPGADYGQDQVDLWQSIFLSLASEKYGPAWASRLMNELMYGVLDLSNSTVMNLINETNNYYLLITKYDCPGWQSMNWAEAAAMLLQGAAVFQVSGSELIDYALTQGVMIYPAAPQYLNNTNINVMFEPFPGTGGVYVLSAESVAVPIHGNATTRLSREFAEFWSSYKGELAWSSAGGCLTWFNSTSVYAYPTQQYICKDLVNIPSYDFAVSLSHGGLFPDSYSYLSTQLVNLQERGMGYLGNFSESLLTFEKITYSGWVNASRIGLSYLGYDCIPFANYLPPWINPRTCRLQQYSPWWISVG
ncbi:MAG: hypothetical protein RXR11_06395 [Caldivirga sp.]